MTEQNNPFIEGKEYAVSEVLVSEEAIPQPDRTPVVIVIILSFVTLGIYLPIWFLLFLESRFWFSALKCVG